MAKSAGNCMPSKFLLLCCLFFASCRFGHCSTVEVDAVPSAAALLSVPADGAPRRGVLYRIHGQGQTSYLFGTIHVGKQGFFPLEPEVTRALASASNLVMELDIRESEPFSIALNKYGFYVPGDTIRNHLSAEAMARLESALRRAGIELPSVAHYKPWLMANMLVGLELERHGFQRSQGVENFLLAASPHKKVVGLESADYQLSLFATLDDVQQERYLLENLDDLQDGNALKKSQSLIDAWSAADAEKIDRALLELTTGNTVSSHFMQRTLLDKRNPEMATAIENIMKDKQAAFVGVGVLHLIGANGLPQLLMQRGYEVEKVY